MYTGNNVCILNLYDNNLTRSLFTFLHISGGTIIIVCVIPVKTLMCKKREIDYTCAHGHSFMRIIIKLSNQAKYSDSQISVCVGRVQVFTSA